MKKGTFTAGAVCVRLIWPRPTSMPRLFMPLMEAGRGGPDGGELTGTGILISTPSLSFLGTVSSIVPSAGVSIRRGGSINHHSTDMADMDTDIHPFTTTSVLTSAIGAEKGTMPRAPTITTEFTAVRVLQVVSALAR